MGQPAAERSGPAGAQRLRVKPPLGRQRRKGLMGLMGLKG
jgi:hypothetical protein